MHTVTTSDINSNKPTNGNISANQNHKPQPPMSSENASNQDGKSPKIEPSSETVADAPVDTIKKENSTPDDSDVKDSSLPATAFTILLDDEIDASKKLTIKDSIKKFAPPKSFSKFTNSKDELYQNSCSSYVDSGPTSLPNRNSHFSRANSHRSSQSSRHSNISESAAFLIDRMLNTSQKSGGLNKVRAKQSIKMEKLNDQDQSMIERIVDAEVDRCDDKSDNGTYIVGTDPESDVARRKIDELFGVVKAAEESIIAGMVNSQSKRDHKQPNPSTQNQRGSRSSHMSDKQALSRDRQEHINRLAKNPSRSSSVTRNDNSSTSPDNTHRRASSRHSRNSSCDRQSSSRSRNNRRRSASQTSRSSFKADNRQLDGESNSGSRSPSQCVADESFGDPIRNTPSMKFNRAFALRRARLGLGDPRLVNEPEMTIAPTSNKRNISSSTHNRPSQANFSRDDGGRFSLRTRNNYVPFRAASAQASNRSPQHGPTQDSPQSRYSQKQQLSGTALGNKMPINELGDTINYTSCTTRYGNRILIPRTLSNMHKRSPSEYDAESNDSNPYSGQRFVYPDQESSLNNEFKLLRSRDNGPKLGALDNLVLSAISSLSTKVRHSVCDILLERAKQLPAENETRLIVEEILPQIADEFSSDTKSPSRAEELDQSIHLDLSKTLKNLKKMEQMVAVISLINEQLTSSSPSISTKTTSLNSIRNSTSSINTLKSSIGQAGDTSKISDASTLTTLDSSNEHELSPI